MKKYEAMLVLKPTDELVDDTVDKVKKFIANKNGVLHDVNVWGRKELAFDVDGYSEGNYVLVYFLGERSTRKGLDDYLKLQENVLRHLVVKCVA